MNIRCIWMFICVQGDRFGGALDAAAKEFGEAYDAGMIPMEFVNSMRKKGQLIMGIGHRVKSVQHRFDAYIILTLYGIVRIAVW